MSKITLLAEPSDISKIEKEHRSLVIYWPNTTVENNMDTSEPNLT